ncbi:HU family DNA-binding protein [Paracoccus benzoatiresistens]|uniref:HU family DNA-binding protein n=1 Tax=Paracoccus benzoatiresistens TaxID=2997341 RepID=A0ABT4J2S6_9RHOB|nr:HU family DNA-binding protein [Paracoccus sp. EF6]MCZ0961194.1 HU family DNA-binding protein [Paracoccus sp. EF6]
MIKRIGAADGDGGSRRNPQPAQVLQKKDFVDRVVAASGAKKADARPIIEATLAQLGKALSAGETLAVPPLGRARVNLERDQRGGEIITLRLRRRPASIRQSAHPAVGD